jgi:hypothetical protein
LFKVLQKAALLLVGACYQGHKNLVRGNNQLIRVNDLSHIAEEIAFRETENLTVIPKNFF